MTSSRQRALVIGLIVIGVLFVGFFGLRFFHVFREFRGHRPPHFPRPGNQPAQTDVELIRDWMTLPYISVTYHLPPNMLYDALKIPPEGNEHKSLKQLNDKYYPQSAGYVLKTVKAIILAHEPPTPTETAVSSLTVLPTMTLKP